MPTKKIVNLFYSLPSVFAQNLDASIPDFKAEEISWMPYKETIHSK